MISLLVLIAGVAALIYSLATSAKLESERDKITAAVLVQAREALIGRAASDDNRPGSLSCPDIDNDGVLTLGVDYGGGGSCTSNVGRLPWRTLGLPDLRDSSGERLWYALSSNFQDASGVTINSDTLGQLTITGTAPANNVIAIVFAPGPLLGSQLRNIANENNVANYLEGENANGDTLYTTALLSTTFNDRLLPITSDALFSVVEKRVAKDVLNALNGYFSANNYYPPPAVPSDATCLGSGTLLATDCPSDPLPPGGLVHDTGRIPNLPLLAPYGGSSDSLRGVVACPSSTYWFQCNGWREVTWMAASSLCLAGPTCPLGNLIVWWRPYGTSTTNQKIVVFVAGRALAGDARATIANKTTPSNYVETANVSGPNYDKSAVTTTFNDKVFHN